MQVTASVCVYQDVDSLSGLHFVQIDLSPGVVPRMETRMAVQATAAAKRMRGFVPDLTFIKCKHVTINGPIHNLDLVW